MPKKIPLFCILDLDRTLVRTDDLRELYEGSIEVFTSITVQQIHQERERIKSNFDVPKYVRMQLAKEGLPAVVIEETMAKARQVFMEKARMQDLLEPYAQNLLDYLQTQRLAYGVLTAGGNEWQTIKLEAAKLETIPHLIVNTTHKGQLIAGWRQPDGTFLLPDELSGQREVVAESLAFLDDKTVSFQDIPETVKAVRVISLSAQEPYEPELPLPPSVTEVRGLHEAMEVVKSLVA